MGKYVYEVNEKFFLDEKQAKQYKENLMQDWQLKIVQNNDERKTMERLGKKHGEPCDTVKYNMKINTSGEIEIHKKTKYYSGGKTFDTMIAHICLTKHKLED